MSEEDFKICYDYMRCRINQLNLSVEWLQKWVLQDFSSGDPFYDPYKQAIYDTIVEIIEVV
jgi:hypothetical protein